MKTLLLSFALLTCSYHVMGQDTRTQLSSAYQHSAFALFNAVAQQEIGNVCFSPLSVQMALSMVQNGAGGNTLNQLQRTLGTEGFSNEEIGQFNRFLTQALTERPPYVEERYQWFPEDAPHAIYDGLYPQCGLANSLWTRPDAQLYDAFVQTLRTDYDACVETVHFDTWEGIEKINAWASEKTHGLIPTIYAEPQLSGLAVMLANALYFKGAWNVPFYKENTEKDSFLLNDENYVEVDMMCARDRYECAITPSFRTITLYYGVERDFSMTLFLPIEGTTLPTLTYDDWNAAKSVTNLHINLYMPRFDVSGNYNLVQILKDLGVTDAFNSMKADLTKMCEENRAISSISQFSKIQVDEIGTEAAAVTVIETADGIDLTSPEDYQDFRIDRPFYFTIQSKKNKAILLVGRVTKLNGSQGQVNSVQDLPASQIVNTKSLNCKWFDLTGRRLSTPPAKGVYIRDGKKEMNK